MPYGIEWELQSDLRFPFFASVCIRWVEYMIYIL